MKSFLLDTSSEHALLAVAEEEKVLFATDLPGGPSLSKSLGAETKKILDQFPPPYERIILGVGPGSFTGIRVGAAMAQALSFGWQIPLYTVSSLTAFAPFIESRPFAVAIDARSGGIYVQINFDKPKRLALLDAALALSACPLIASPHPSKIIHRLPDLSSSQWVETRPNPFHLIRKASLAPVPLILDYLSPLV